MSTDPVSLSVTITRVLLFVHALYVLVVGRSIGLHRSAILDPNAVLFSCAAIELVQVNDPQFDVVMAFPESADFER